MRQILAEAINRMPEREKIVLTLYYYEGLTLAEIGQVLGVTESRVCQIHTKAVLQLRVPHGRVRARARLAAARAARRPSCPLLRRLPPFLVRRLPMKGSAPMPRALSVVCAPSSRRRWSRAVGWPWRPARRVGAAAVATGPPVSTHPVVDPFRSARPAALRAGQPGARVRHRPGTAVPRGRRRRRHLRRAGRRDAPRHGAARRRPAHHVLVPRPRSTSCVGQRVAAGRGSRHHGRPPALRRSRPATPTSTRHRLFGGRPRCASSRSTTRRARTRRRAQRDPPAHRRDRRCAAGRGRRVADGVVAGTGATADWLRHEGPQTVRTAAHYLTQAGPGAAPTPAVAWRARRVVGGCGSDPTRPCTPTAYQPPPVATAWSGGSRCSSAGSAARATTPPSTTSTPPRSATRRPTSCASATRAAAPRIPPTACRRCPPLPYGSADTPDGSAALAGRGSPISSSQWSRAAPGVPIDVIAHSQGGLVARLALHRARATGTEPAWLRAARAGRHARHAARRRRPRHRGLRGRHHPAGSVALERAGGRARPRPRRRTAPSVQQLAETSDLVAELARDPAAGRRPLRVDRRPRRPGRARAPHRRRPAPRRSWSRSSACTPTTRSRAARRRARELALALAGLPPTCTLGSARRSPTSCWGRASAGSRTPSAQRPGSAPAVAGLRSCLG